jgi:competence protein ComEC
VVIFWLLFDPWLSVSYSFGLSSISSAAIILGTKPCTQFLEKYVGKTAATLIAVPLVAQIGCSPILLLMNSYISPYAVLANIIVAPFASPVTILSLIACIFAPILPAVSLLIARLASVLAAPIAEVANFSAHLPLAKFPWIPGAVGILLFALLVLLFFLAPALYRRIYSKITGLAPREMTSLTNRSQEALRKLSAKIKQHRLRSTAVVICIALISAGAYYGIADLGWFSKIPGNWLIAACDVGQGDMGVVRTGAHSAVVIDVGPKDASAGKCLQKLGVNTVDMVVLSHYHDDHVGDLENALSNVQVSQALLDPVKQPAHEVQEVDRVLDKKGARKMNAFSGQRGEFGCETSAPYCVKWEVVSVYDDASEDGSLHNNGEPLNAGNGHKTSGEDDRENDSSVAMLFEVNGITYFTAGDLETRGSAGALRKLRSQNIAGVDVVKVNHHGSKTQSKPLINQLSPTIAVYMVGKNNYGHPNAQTVQAFEELGAKTLRTDTMGLCLIGLNADGDIITFSEK